jgi:hypothetical protein
MTAGVQFHAYTFTKAQSFLRGTLCRIYLPYSILFLLYEGGSVGIQSVCIVPPPPPPEKEMQNRNLPAIQPAHKAMPPPFPTEYVHMPRFMFNYILYTYDTQTF